MSKKDRREPAEVLEVARLDTEQYRRLEAQCTAPYVGSNDTGVTAAFALGQQFVLKLVREGFVIGR